MKQSLSDADSFQNFDYSQGLERFQGNRELYFKILGDFSTRYRSFSAAVKSALAGRDRGKAHKLVHDLKGLAGNLSATALYQAALSLDETLSKPTPDWAEIEKRFCDFERALEQAVNAVDRLTKERQRPWREPIIPKSLPASLAADLARNIRRTVELGDIMAIAELASDPSLGYEIRNRIDRLLDELDFAGLAELANELDEESTRKCRSG